MLYTMVRMPLNVGTCEKDVIQPHLPSLLLCCIQSPLALFEKAMTGDVPDHAQVTCISSSLAPWACF